MFEREPGYCAERALWTEVLTLAISDALKGVPSGGSRYRIADTVRAREYLTTPSKDLDFVCAGAGIDMESLIDRMKIAIAKAPAPEELIGTPKPKPRPEPKPKPKPRPEPKSNPMRRIAAAKTARSMSTGRLNTGLRLTYLGRTQSIAEWSIETGIQENTIYKRLKAELPIDQVLYAGSLRTRIAA